MMENTRLLPFAGDLDMIQWKKGNCYACKYMDYGKWGVSCCLEGSMQSAWLTGKGILLTVAEEIGIEETNYMRGYVLLKKECQKRIGNVISRRK